MKDRDYLRIKENKKPWREYFFEKKTNYRRPHPVYSKRFMPNQKVLLFAGAILVLLSLVILIKPGNLITGYSVRTFNEEATLLINRTYNETFEYNLTPTYSGTLRSIKVSGEIIGSGRLKAKLVTQDRNYTIYDSGYGGEGLNPITGNVPRGPPRSDPIDPIPERSGRDNTTGNQSDEDEPEPILPIPDEPEIDDRNDTQNSNGSQEPSINETQELANLTNPAVPSSPPESNTTDTNQTINLTRPIQNESQQNQTDQDREEDNSGEDSDEQEISIDLKYKPGTIWDEEDDGVEPADGVIDLTVEDTEFNWDVDESKLCTKWGVYSQEEALLTQLCFGSSECCTLVGLSAREGFGWDDPLEVYLGRYGATNTNQVLAEVLYGYFDMDPDNPQAEFSFSDQANLSAQFLEPGQVRYFDEECAEACLLSLNQSSYSLVFEIDNSTVYLSNVSYSLEARQLRGQARADQVRSALEKPIRFDKKIERKFETEDKVRVIVKKKNSGSAGGRVLEGLDRYEVKEIDLFDLNALNERTIESVHVDEPVSLLTYESMNIINANMSALGLSLDGSGKSICFIDTGINYSHSAITNYYDGYDFVNNDFFPMDDHGHGTEVGGIISILAPGSRLYAAKVLNATGGGYESDILEGLQWCIDEEVDIISFSIGAGSYTGYCDDNIVAELVNEAVAQGIAVFAATGNDGNTSMKAPSCASGAMRVSAVDKSDSIASFANVNIMTDVFAPGVSIQTTDIGGGYTTVQGTSMSAPMAAAAGALILENESLQPSELKFRMTSTGKPISYAPNSSLTINISRINVWNALINNVTVQPYNYTSNQTGGASPETYQVLSAGSTYYPNSSGVSGHYIDSSAGVEGTKSPYDPAHANYRDHSSTQRNYASSNDGTRNSWTAQNPDLTSFVSYVNLWYNFSIDEDESEVDQINITWDGYNNYGATQYQPEFIIFIWNSTSETWSKLHENFTRQASDYEVKISLDSSSYNLSDFIDDNGDIHIGIVGDGKEYLSGICFAPETPITLADGSYKAISDVKIGDKVTSWDFETNSQVETEVSRIWSGWHEGLYSINNAINVTAEHPFWTLEAGWAAIAPDKTLESHGWRPSKLKLGMNMLGDDGNYKPIESIEQIDGTYLTYNLYDVQEYHNYFAGGALVHNKKCAYLFSQTEEGEYFEDITLSVFEDPGNPDSPQIKNNLFKENEEYSYINLEKHTNRFKLAVPPHEMNYIDHVYLKVIDTRNLGDACSYPEGLSKGKLNDRKQDTKVTILNLMESTEGFELLRLEDDQHFVLDGQTRYPHELELTFEAIPPERDGYARKIQYAQKGYSEIFNGSRVYHDFSPFNQSKYRDWLHTNDNLYKLTKILEYLKMQHVLSNASHSSLFQQYFESIEKPQDFFSGPTIRNEDAKVIRDPLALCPVYSQNPGEVLGAQVRSVNPVAAFTYGKEESAKLDWLRLKITDAIKQDNPLYGQSAGNDKDFVTKEVTYYLYPISLNFGRIEDVQYADNSALEIKKGIKYVVEFERLPDLEEGYERSMELISESTDEMNASYSYDDFELSCTLKPMRYYTLYEDLLQLDIGVTGAPECGEITTDTTLINNVSAAGTCFTIGANDITLDCAGYTLEFGTSTDDSAGIYIDGYNGTIIKNCHILKDSANAPGYGLNITNAYNISIYNNTINLTGYSGGASPEYTYAIFANGNVENMQVYSNAINTYSSVSYGIYLYSSINNTLIYSNNVTSVGKSLNINDECINVSVYGNNMTSNANIAVGLLNDLDDIKIYDNYLRTLAGSTFSVMHISRGLTNSQFYSNDMYAEAAGAKGIILDNSGYAGTISYNNFTNLTISSYETAIHLEGAHSGMPQYGVFNNSFVNITLLNLTSESLYAIDCAYNNTLVNSTVNSSRINVSSSGTNSLMLQWYVRTNVAFANGTGVEGASVNISDVNDDQKQYSSTDSEGATSWITITDRKFTNSGTTSYNNYTFKANYSSYDANTTSLNVSGTQVVSLQLYDPNTPPTSPTDLNLSAVNVSDTLTADCGGSTDEDTDPITYYYYFYNVNDTSEVQDWATDNTYVIQASDAHDVINVTCKAHDGSDYSSGNYSNSTNVDNSVPTQPTQNSPDDEGTVSVDWALLNCSSSSDADSDALTYLYWGDSGSGTTYLGTNDVDTAYNWTGLSDSTTYTWKCGATDSIDNSTNTTTRTFNITINDAPTHDDPSLTPESPYTTDDLVCTSESSSDPDGDAVQNTIVWYKDSEPLALVHMSFNINYTGSSGSVIRDYSGRENNGTLSGGSKPIWVDSGKMGGAYEFDGDNTRIDVGDIGLGSSYTKAAWVYRKDSGGTPSLNVISSTSATNGHVLYCSNSQGYRCSAGHAPSYNAAQDPNPLPIDSWQHIAVTYDADSDLFVLYRNGTEVNRSTLSTDHNQPNIHIGAFASSSGWEGYLDDVRVYNFSMSPDQIAQIYSDTDGGSTSSETMVSNETTTSEEWYCEITPDDGVLFGTTKSSSSVTIQSNNAPANPTPSIGSEDGANTTESDINCSAVITDSDSDDLNVSVRWYNGGELNQTIDYNNNYASGTLFNATLEAGNTSKGQNWSCSMQLDDGMNTSSWASSENITILNTAPVIQSSRIDPSPTAYDNSTLVGYCNATDVDGDSVSYFWQWYVNDGVNASGSNTTAYTEGVEANVHNITSSNLSAGDYWNFSCIPNDGTVNGSSWMVSVNTTINQSSSSENTCTPTSGAEWIINQSLSCSNELIVVSNTNITATGNLTLTNVTLITGNATIAGNLSVIDSTNTVWQNENLIITGLYILDNSTMRVNGTSNGSIGISVESGGEMQVINGANVSNGNDADVRYFFRVHSGSTFNMSGSYLSYAGWADSAGNRGLMINSSTATVENSFISNSYVGLMLYGDSANVINNTISDVDLYGIYILGPSYYHNIYENRITADDTATHGIYVKFETFASNSPKYVNISNNYINATGSTGYGIRSSAAHYIDAKHNRVNGTTAAFHLSNSHNNTIYNNTCATTGTAAHAIIVSNTDFINITSNTVSTYGNTATAIFFNGNTHNATAHRNTLTTVGTNARGVYLSGLNYDISVTENSITASNSGSHGLLIGGGGKNNTFRSNNVTTTDSAAYGAYVITGSHNNYFIDNIFDTYATGLYIMSSDNVSFTNCTILNLTPSSVYIETSTGTTLVNTAFNDSSVTQGAGPNDLTVKWFYQVNVTDSGYNPIEDALVNVTDVDCTNVLSDLSAATGLTSWVTLTDRIINSTATVTYNNHTINVSKSGYDTNQTSQNITQTQVYYVMLENWPPVMQTVRIDPSPTAYDNSTLEGYCNATDGAGDDLTYYYKWYVNETINLTGTGAAGQTQSVEINVANLTSSNLSAGQLWIFSCLAYDGENNSSWLNSSATEITSPDSAPTITWSAPENDNSSTFDQNFTHSVLFEDDIGLYIVNCTIYSDEAQTSSVWSYEYNVTGNLSYVLTQTVYTSSWLPGTYYENCTITDEN